MKNNEIIQKHKAEILSNDMISDGIYEMKLVSPEIASSAICGQFVNLYLTSGEMLLPRPFGVSDAEDEVITVVYAVVGNGTKKLSQLCRGDVVELLGPNGTGYDFSKIKKHILIVGGGLGVPPLLLLSKQLANEKINNKTESISSITAVLGYRESPFYSDEIKKYCDEVYSVSETKESQNPIYTKKGNVVDVLSQLEVEDNIEIGEAISQGDVTILACGPKPMLKALHGWAEKRNISSQFSLEERMGCGYGACVGCACTIISEDGKAERKKVCKDGPVFEGHRIVWE